MRTPRPEIGEFRVVVDRNTSLPSVDLIALVVREVFDQREHRGHAVLRTPCGNRLCRIVEERVVELTRERGSVFAVLKVLDPLVHANRVCVEQRLRLFRRFLIERVLGRLSLPGREQRPEVGKAIRHHACKARIENSREATCRKPASNVHLRKAIERVVVAQRHRAVLVGCAVCIEYASRVEVDGRVGRPLEVTHRAAAAACAVAAAAAEGCKSKNQENKSRS